MQDIIQLLPEALANQIAAGEVVQRPASAVKELLENAIDAHATRIQLFARDAGKAFIQVIDNGAGMSHGDALRCFQRHATSKIKESADLFKIHTFGFRGEALASIAAVAQVELRTRPEPEELGTRVSIEGGEVLAHEEVACPQGTIFTIKNLFFNVPARRNFLKSAPVELKYITEEFERVALCHPEVTMSFHHNDQEIYSLTAGTLAKRITSLLGKALQDKMMPCQEEVSHLKIWGFIGKPDVAKKTRGEQFFFANGRYIRHNYLHHAVMSAYEGLLPEGSFPFYLLNIDLDPKHIDVNVHPTKTEVKFDDERTLYALVRSGVKRALAHHGALPPIDFGYDVNFGMFDNAFDKKPADREAPGVSFTPMDVESQREKNNLKHWESLYTPSTPKPMQGNWEQPSEGLIFSSKANDIRPDASVQSDQLSDKGFLQVRNRYVLTQVKSGLMMIDQEAAMERILYERYAIKMNAGVQGASQRLVFPRSISLSQGDFALIMEMQQELRSFGLEVEEFGRDAIVIQGVPIDATGIDEQDLLESVLEQLKVADLTEFTLQEQAMRALVKRLSRNYVKPLRREEMASLIEQLFTCAQPGYTPGGQKTIAMLTLEQLGDLFA